MHISKKKQENAKQAGDCIKLTNAHKQEKAGQQSSLDVRVCKLTTHTIFTANPPPPPPPPIL